MFCTYADTTDTSGIFQGPKDWALLLTEGVLAPVVPDIPEDAPQVLASNFRRPLEVLNTAPEKLAWLLKCDVETAKAVRQHCVQYSCKLCTSPA